MGFIKRVLTPPLIVFAALLMWCEEWLWVRLKRLTRILAHIPPIHWYEAFLVWLPPYPTMFFFLLPGTLLIPVKLLAVYWMTQGHWMLSVLTIVGAKILGTAIVARSYVICHTKLMTIDWFRRCHDWLILTRDRLYSALLSLPLYQALRRQVASFKACVRNVWRRYRGRRGLWARWKAIRRLHRQQRLRSDVRNHRHSDAVP